LLNESPKMLSRIAFLSCAAAVAANSTIDLEKYSFETFLTDFKLQYNAAELEMRKGLFMKELDRVRAHNAKKLSWTETITKFSAMTSKEKQAYYGRSKGVHAALKKSSKYEKTLPADFVMKPVSALPKNVDWRKSGIVSSVKDQGQCGSCWAFASTATMESHIAKSTGLLFDLSVQQIAMCAPNPDSCGGVGKCEGSTAELAYEYMSSSAGFYQEYQYGYTSYYGVDTDCLVPSTKTNPVAKINGYVKLPDNNYTALMNAVATVGPVAINVDASTFHAYKSGVFNGCNQNSPDVNHVVVTVGYGEDEVTKEKYWLVRNSWSPKFGEEGYIRLARSDNDESNCGSDVTPQDGVSCSGQVDPVKVCGTCGAIYDSSYPINASLL